ncbi:skin secretory protein xP2-like [Belonocnema kinseyi]|uniref:skin secretory protein xP2-like n=1 Tax=Belonocnema kinseyi TaxID=2817044 RepID=UPI00143D89B1|nr:skin secretory protein xP2-like [Belonocnema kinseyi]
MREQGCCGVDLGEVNRGNNGLSLESGRESTSPKRSRSRSGFNSEPSVQGPSYAHGLRRQSPEHISPLGKEGEAGPTNAQGLRINIGHPSEPQRPRQGLPSPPMGRHVAPAPHLALVLTPVKAPAPTPTPVRAPAPALTPAPALVRAPPPTLTPARVPGPPSPHSSIGSSDDVNDYYDLMQSSTSASSRYSSEVDKDFGMG